MIRVLQNFGSLNRGGLETFVMNVYRAIDRSQIQFDFLVTAKGDYADEIESMGGRIFVIPPRNKGLWAYRKNLDEFFRTHATEFAAIHCHASSLTSLEPLAYAKKHGVRNRLLHSHSSSISRSLSTYYILLATHTANKLFVKRLATHYLGCSQKALDWMFCFTGCRSKVIMINNGIDVDKFRYDETKRKAARKELHVDNDTILLGHVGRFAAVKNHGFLIDTFYELLKERPNAKLLMVGTGELVDSMKRKCHQLDIVEKVIFAGVREDIDKLLQAMDIFVMPSLFEGLPVTLVEAQAAGVPILASDAISTDVRMTELLHFYPLSKTPHQWMAEALRVLKASKRVDTSLEITEAGFDIKTSASILSQIYRN